MELKNLRIHSDFNSSPKYEEKLYWNSINVFFAVFIFFAIAYPMPTQSKLGFLSPILVGLLGLSLVVNLLRSQTAIYWNNYVLKICFIFFLLIVSDLVTAFFVNPTQQLLYTAARIATILIFLTGLSFFPSLINLFKIIKVYLWSIAILSILTIAEGLSLVKFSSSIHRPRSFFGVTMPFKKAVGFDMSDGEFGIMVAPAFLFLLIQFLPKSDLKPIRGRFFLIIITGIALFISQSRSMWLGLLFSAGTIILLLAKRKIRTILLTTVCVISIIILLTGVHSIILKGAMGEGVYKRNVTNRLNAYLEGWNYFKKSPLIGVGHGNVTYTIPGRGHDVLIHNQLIDQLAATGILGFIPLFALYIIFFRTGLRLYRDARDPVHRGLVIWITASMVHAFTELMLYRGFYSEHLPWYFAMLGILYSIRYGYREVVLKDRDKTSRISSLSHEI